MPEKIDPNLPIGSPKHYDEIHKKIFGVRFTPHSDSSKRLDISVTYIPLEYPDGKYEWCVWKNTAQRKTILRKNNKILPTAKVKIYH